MKLITSLGGLSAFRASPDDIAPKQSVSPAVLHAELTREFKFIVAQPIMPVPQPPGVVSSTAQLSLSFEQGSFEHENTNIPINRLYFSGVGAAVETSTTETSDIVLSRLINLLDDTFGFAITRDHVRIDHLSNLVVELDEPYESQIAVFQRMAELITKAIGHKEAFQLKRLAFGTSAGDPALLGLNFDNADFLLERRLNEPFSRNRYFSSAPLTTSDHMRVLEQLEGALRDSR